MAPTSILERNQEKGPQKVREQGFGEERDWLETGACIDCLREEERRRRKLAWDGSGASLGPSPGIQLRELRCSLYPLLRSAANSPGQLATAREGQTVLIGLRLPHASCPHSCIIFREGD